MSEALFESAYDPRPDAAGPPLGDPQRPTRRSVPRLIHCLLTPAAGGAAVAAMAVDCTARGLDLAASRRLEPGAAAVVRLPAAGPERPGLDLPVRVVRCEGKGTGWFVVGVEFLPPLGEREARLLRARMNGRAAGG